MKLLKNNIQNVGVGFIENLLLRESTQDVVSSLKIKKIKDKYKLIFGFVNIFNIYTIIDDIETYDKQIIQSAYTLLLYKDLLNLKYKNEYIYKQTKYLENKYTNLYKDEEIDNIQMWLLNLYYSIKTGDKYLQDAIKFSSKI